MKVQVAIYTLPGRDQSTWDVHSADVYENAQGYVRRSEIVEVELPDLPRESTTPQELAILDGMERKARADLQMKLNEIKDQRAKVLAITDQRSAA